MKIKIYATSDIHGTLTPYRYSDNTEMKMGMMKLSPFMKKDEFTLFVDNGDVLQGSPLDAYYQIEHHDIHPVAKVFNHMKYDYINIGNHEFNYGKDGVWQYLEESKATCITSNLFDQGKCFGKEYAIHEFDENHKIALIGVTTQYIPNWEQPCNIEGMTFENAFDIVKKRVETIKEKENVQGIVVVYHGGFERNLETGEPTEQLTGENLGYKMCHEIEGIDLLITGHQHRSIAGFCGNTCVTQTALNAQEVAYIEWDLDKHELTPTLIHADTEIDESLLSLFEEEEKATQAYLDQPIGKMKDGDLLIHDEFQARLHKHPIISFLNQVQTYCTHAQLSSCALFNGATGFRNEITMRDLASTYPYPNTLVVLKITGSILKQYLEKCAEYFSIIDDEIAVTPRYIAPKPQHYNYDMVDGCDYTIKVSNPVGSRIVDLRVNEKEVKEDDTFTIVVNNYRAACGGDFFMFKDCEIVASLQDDMVECLTRYMKENPLIEVNHKENIKIMK